MAVYNNIYDENLLIDNFDFKYDYKKEYLLGPSIYTKNRKTYIYNFLEISISINRSKEDIKKFFINELMVKATLTHENLLKIDQYVPLNRIEKIYKNYIKNNVICNCCNSIKTILIKENRNKYIKCNKCFEKRILK